MDYFELNTKEIMDIKESYKRYLKMTGQAYKINSRGFEVEVDKLNRGDTKVMRKFEDVLAINKKKV